ncbi:MAG: M20/M25/M40 family metallo-hydrolase [Lachnospiraceae bacterium]|nr:M20/M25/M40 family metallo-hydrolase [Lachnospiraceae bacterium]
MTALYIVLGLIGLLILLVLIAVIRTLLTPAKTSEWQPKRDSAREAEYAEKLAEMVRFETVSYKGQIRRERFLEFHKILERMFPLVHANLEKTEIDGSLLYYWKGKHSDKPLVLMGHQDVVPAEGQWKHEPFSGDIADGKVWGRGSADTKCSVMSFFQAVEELLKDGFVPEQDVYLSTANDEEVAGEGCPKLVAELKKRGVKPYIVNDEGGSIVTEPMAGLKGNFAMVGVLEKGQGNLKIIARSGGGHSSYPPKNSPIVRLSKFVTELSKHNPMKSSMNKQAKEMFGTMAPYGPFWMRLLFGNLWLFRPLLEVLMPSISSQAAALLRTTIAPTMQTGSDGCNVLPQEATLVLNLRYIPHQDMDESNEIIRKIAEKHGLEVELIDAHPAYDPVDAHSDAFRLVGNVIEEVFPGLPIVPYVMTGGTDARHYQQICDACLRFSPVVYGPEQMKGMHGLNENLDTYSLPGAVDYYKALIRKMEKA